MTRVIDTLTLRWHASLTVRHRVRVLGHSAQPARTHRRKHAHGSVCAVTGCTVRGTRNITDPPTHTPLPAAGRSAQSRGASRVQTADRDRSNPQLVNKHLQPAHLLSCAPGTYSSAGSRASVSGCSFACSSVTCTVNPATPGGVRAHSGTLKTHRGKRRGRGHARLRHSREREGERERDQIRSNNGDPSARSLRPAFVFLPADDPEPAPGL